MHHTCHSVPLRELVWTGMPLLPQHMFECGHLEHLALVFVHECLPEEVLIYLVWEEFQYQVHHNLPVEVPRIDQMIDV